MNLERGYIFLYEKRIILDFAGPTLKSVNCSHLQISSTTDSMSAFDILMFLPLRYMLTVVGKQNGFEWSWYYFW